MDTSGEPLRHAVDAGVFLIKPNLRELGQLCGHEIDDESVLGQVAADSVKNGGSENVVVSMGAAGALWASKTEQERISAPTVSMQSRVGAGDSSVAGIALALARGKPIEEAIRLGVAAGSAAAMTPGSELCRGADTERLFALMLNSIR